MISFRPAGHTAQSGDREGAVNIPDDRTGGLLRGRLGRILILSLTGVSLAMIAAVFFVKHAFERNYITPKMRVLIGGATGLGLIAGGLWMPRARR